MNEEINNIIEETEVADVMEVIEEPVANSGDGMVKVLIGLGVLVVAGTGILVYKCRNKIWDRIIRKLEQKGYIIYKPEATENTIDVDSEDYEER